MSPTPAETIEDWECTASILCDAAVDLGAELERVRAELNDVREVLELVEQERDEYRGAITAHKRAIWSEIGRPGSKMDRDLWEVLR